MAEPWREAWEEASEGLLLHEGGRVRYLNPAASRLLGVEPQAVLDRPLLFALRDEAIEALARAGWGEGVLEREGRRVRVRARPGRLYLTELAGEGEEELEAILHELRTPVAGLVGLIEALELDLPEAERRRVRALVRTELGRLVRLVSGDRPAVGPNPWPLSRLKERLFRLLPETRGVRWHTPHRVRVEEDALFQVLLNLVENALKYGRPPIAVRSLPAEDGGLYLLVSDHGEPLPDYEGLFAPGRRGRQTPGGKGLGLSIVARIARGFGGRPVAGRFGETNAFGVYIPRKLWEVQDAGGTG